MSSGIAASSPSEAPPSFPLQASLLEANLTIFWLLFAAALVFFQQVRFLEHRLHPVFAGDYDRGTP